MKRVTILMLFVQLIGVAVARAQTADDVEVAGERGQVQTNGAEKLAGGSLHHRAGQQESERRRAFLGTALRRILHRSEERRERSPKVRQQAGESTSRRSA